LLTRTATMAFNVPTSTQWISFPIDIARSVTVEWKENLVQRQAVYFVTKCFFGPLEGEKLHPDAKVDSTQAVVPATAGRLPTPVVETEGKKIIVYGSADLFVGSEYYDALYQKGAVQDFHLRDICPSGQ
jgi:hypothetical protein